MLENKKGKITGLGDLSILSLCDMTRQFHNDENFTTIGVTFDVRLYGILSTHSSIVSHSDPILLGGETKESIGRKLGDFYERGQKLTEANKAATDFFREFADCLREMEWVKGAISSDLKRIFTD